MKREKNTHLVCPNVSETDGKKQWLSLIKNKPPPAYVDDLIEPCLRDWSESLLTKEEIKLLGGD